MAKKNKKNQIEEEVLTQEEQNISEEQNDISNNIEEQTEDNFEQVQEEVEEETNEQKLENELMALKDKHLRLQAEFDNYRKRTLQEKAELIKSAGESILVNILPVIDDFDRALDFFEKADSVDAMKEGMDLISNKFQSFLKQSGVSVIEAKEQDFDTDKHEALTKIPAPTENLKGKVVDVIEKGYELNSKVIRFAKVVIGE